MASEGRISYYIDKYGVFHKVTEGIKSRTNVEVITEKVAVKASSTWLRLIVMFWNARVMKAAFRFGVAAVVMNQYERVGFALLLLCFAV